jgi:hypothetical protein
MAPRWHDILPMREVNTIIRAESALVVPVDEPIAFVCECDHDDCCATVWLTAREYDDLVRDVGEIAAPSGHAAAQVCSSAA